MPPPRRPFTAERTLSPHAGRTRHDRDMGDGTEAAAILRAIEGLSERMGALEHRVERALPLDEDAVEVEPPAPEPVMSEKDQRQLDESRILRTEITALARSIEETKAEIAKLRDQRPEGDRLTVMAHEMDAIVGATEIATNGILDIAEAIASRVAEIQAQEKDSYIRHLADEVQEKLLGVFEHCNFQDLTGQRITKVVNTMKFIEARLDRMMDIWGRDGFLVDQDEDGDAEALDALAEREKRLLNGPQTGTAGISQDEIDALFD